MSRTEKRVGFRRPTSLKSSRPKVPIPTLDSLIQHQDFLISNSLKISTKKGYKSALRHWKIFTTTYGFEDCPTAVTLPLYCTFLSQRLSNIPKALSSLAFYYKDLVADWENIRSQPVITQIINGHRKTSTHQISRALSILPDHLRAVVSYALRPSASYDDLLAAAVVIAFGALLRLGECFMPQSKDLQDARQLILRSSVELVVNKSLAFILPYHKADRFFQSSQVLITSDMSTSDFNFIDLIEAYMQARDSAHGIGGYLFVRENGRVPQKLWFDFYLSRLAPSTRGRSGLVAHRTSRPGTLLPLRYSN